MTDEKREIELLRRENRALEDDNFQKCEIITELKGRIKKLDRENLGLRQQVENLKRKGFEEGMHKFFAQNKADLIARIESEKKIDADLETALKQAMDEYLQQFQLISGM